MEDGVKNETSNLLDQKEQGDSTGIIPTMEPTIDSGHDDLLKAEDYEAKKQRSLERLRELKDLLQDDNDNGIEEFIVPEGEALRNSHWRWK